jgi:hypothetical protein
VPAMRFSAGATATRGATPVIEAETRGAPEAAATRS